METKVNIYKKLAEVKTKIGKLTKDTANPFFKSKYADINQLIEITDPLLLEVGLLALQPIQDGYLITKIVDIESGEEIVSSLKLPEITDPQKVGSAITYYRRYTLKSLLNIQEEDDDANKAAGNHKAQPAKTQEKPALKPELLPNSDAWKEAVKWLADQDGLVFDHLDKIKGKYSISEANEKALLDEATAKRTPVAIPQDTIDAIAAAKSSEEVTKIWNDLTGLHTSKEFIKLIDDRRKEILLPNKKTA